MRDFQGRTAVVTGAASGIGRALAERAAAEGMNVVLADVEAESLAEAVGAIEASGAAAVGVVADVGQADELSKLAERSYEAFGGVHLLCNNAGVFASGGPLWQTPVEDFEWTLGVNVMGIVHGVRAFVPRMLAAGEPAHVVNTASMAGMTAMPLNAAYFSSKHAAVSLSETLFLELSSRGAPIGVSVLCPELVATRIGWAERNRPEHLKPKHDDEPVPERELIQGAIQQSTRDQGLPPSAMADRVFDAVREERFYVLCPPGVGWLESCHARLDAIRQGRNPELVPPTA